MRDLGWNRFVLTSRTSSQLRQCRLVVVSTALSLAGFLPTDGSLFRSCSRLVLHSEEIMWHTASSLSPVFVQGTCTRQVHAHVGRTRDPEGRQRGF
jgi:ABC-type enterobactin transport system permease subunit